ncbi:hypothetical protein containing Ferritin-related domain [Pyrococcus sp. ST04]|nr:hypothetical protein containing Ferritin-related domain [Pyrococcus sp. ST04]
MSEESLQHKEKLYKLFKKLYPNEEPRKIEAPPVEVVPLYPKFETVEDYLEALEYCMKSELFAKDTYEILAQKAINEESRVIFLQLAEMERDHYERLKKAYDLFTSLKSRKMMPEYLKPGGYLFFDKFKARYTFLDLVSNNRDGFIFSRDPPNLIKEWMKNENLSITWISTAPLKGSVTPRAFLDSKEDLIEIMKRGRMVFLVESIEFIIAKEGFKETFELISALRDVAIVSNSHLLVHSTRDTLNEREKAILEAELQVIE